MPARSTRNLMIFLCVLLQACDAPAPPRADADIERAALWLCEHRLERQLSFLTIPVDTDLRQYVRSSDVDRAEALAAHSTIEEAINAFGPNLAAAVGPVTRARGEAEAAHTKCRVLAVDVIGTRASLLAERTTPDADLSGMDRFRELAALPEHQARVERVGEWLQAAEGTRTETVAFVFENTPDGWRAIVEGQ